MPIMLQGTVAFEPEFVGNLNFLTRTMIACGLDPDECLIAKDIADAAALPFVGPIAYDYAVSAGERQFAVTETGDAPFLEAFLHFIDDAGEREPQPAPPGMLSRLTRWMSPPA